MRKQLWNAFQAVGYGAAGIVGAACCYVVAATAVSVWSGATPAGQISTAILAGSAIIAAAIYFASRVRPAAHVTMTCDAIDGLKVQTPGGNAYIIAPNATSMVAAPAAGKGEER